MSLPPEAGRLPVKADPAKRRNDRNRAFLIMLLAFSALLFAITIAKMVH
jgi:hypothetical protein